MGIGCSTKPEVTTPQPLEFTQPEHFPRAHYDFKNNPLTQEGFELGRKLFYDPILSSNGKISCASCHQQENGFSDKGMAFSLGVNNYESLRNSPALANLAWNPAFMMDGGVNHIEVMPVAPITDTLEMGEDLGHLIEKLQGTTEYPALFEKAFGDDSITDQKMLWALAQFMSMMTSYQSKYDQVLQGKDEFSLPEKRGYQLFRQHCVSCHTEPLLTDFSYRNNGLDVYSKDKGRARITRKEADHGKFKVPTLRNVELSEPYMHDGRFNTMKEVLDHYSEGIQASENLDSSLVVLQLSEQEKGDIIQFLKTLTDYEYINREELSRPD